MAVSTIGTMEPFDLKTPHSWGTYCRRFDLFFTANAIDDDVKKRAIFLTLCGGGTFELLESLIAPRKVSDLAFKEIVTQLTDHFSPRTSEITASFKFFKRDQMPEEKAADFIAELRRLAKDCNFPTGSLDRMLRDKIVCGIRDSNLQQQFLAEKTLKLETVIERTVAAETARKDHKSITEAHAQVKFITQPRQPYVNNHRPPTIKTRHQGTPSHCESCGENHPRSTCRFRSNVCSFCKLTGHIQKVCRSNPDNSQITRKKLKKNKRRFNSVKLVSAPPEVKMDTTVFINNKRCKFEVDSGSGYTIISEQTFKTIWESSPKLQIAELFLTDFQQNPIQILGRMDVDIVYNDNHIDQLPLYVTTGNRTSILGRNWFVPLGISIQGVHSIEFSKCADVMEKFQHLFVSELGKFRGPPVSLKLNPEVIPIHLPARRIPIALRVPVEEELDKLTLQGILERVDYSEWATPIVPVLKSDGSVRICGDYKSSVNKALFPHTFPIPSATHLLSTMPRGKIFAKLDLAQAYQQLTVDEKTAIIQTIATHKGAYKVKRLQFGISTAPGIFQNFIENLLCGIEGVIPYFDDVIIIASAEDDLRKKLSEVLQRFDKAGLRLRKDKCSIGCEAVDFLGYRIDGSGLRPTEDKIEAIRKTPPPKDKVQLQAFLGLINFYHTFVKGKATMAEPLHQLLHENTKWQWGQVQQQSFDQLKSALSTDKVLIPYDEHLPLWLVCDASPFGIGIVLTHRVSNTIKSERPIAFYSRTLSTTERRYAQIDKEALAIIAGVKKIHHFLYGRNFTIVTDHKPLLGLFNPEKPTPQILSPRMMRWSVFLNAYQFKIIHRPGKENGNADGLSRLPNSIVPTYEEEEVLLIDMIQRPVVMASDIATSTMKDPILSRVHSWCLRGWPEKVNEQFKPFWMRRTELSCIRDCILWGQRTIIPSNYRQSILVALHTAHPGIVRMKSMARSYVWWPRIDDDIEKLIRSCRPCQENRPENPQAPIQFWEQAKRPWSRVHIDFAGPFQNRVYFILVDSYSKWLEVRIVSTTSTNCALGVLRSLFATHGIPEMIVSDNGTAFSSADFKEFCESNGIQHTLVAPFHSSSNGQAERMVRETKQYLKKEPTGDIHKRLSTFLFHHHATPSTSTGKSPAELLFNRRIGTYFDRLHPDSIPQKKKESTTTNVHPRELINNSRVWARNYASGPKWIPAIVTETTGPVSYRVETENGTLMRRHIDQLRCREDDHLTTKNSSTSIEGSTLPTLIPIESDVSVSPIPDVTATSTQQSTTPNRNLISSGDVRRSERLKSRATGDVPSLGGGM